MTEADKMFRDLDFEKFEGENKIEYVREGCDQIEFDKRIKRVKVSIWNGCSSPIASDFTMKELKAINEKCKELGWIK